MALRKTQGKQQKGESFEQNAQEESKMKEQQKEEQRLQLQQAIEESRLLLIQNKAAEAADRCFFALQKALNSKVFGENSIELMDGYFVLADAYLELGRIKKAEEFMVAAYWNLLKHSSTEKQKTIDQQQGDVSQVNPELLQKLKSTLHKSFGRLFTAQQDYKKAKAQLANCIYLESQEYGPEHIALSRAYYLLANVFTLEKKFDQSMAIFQKIKQIWKMFLNSKEEIIAEDLQLEEGIDILQKMHQFYTDEIGETTATQEMQRTLQDLFNYVRTKRGETQRESYEEILSVKSGQSYEAV